MDISYIHEPTDLQCGQAVLAMVLKKTPEYICEYLDNDRETTLKEMNAGIAMVITKTVLQNFLNLMPLELMIIARIIPPK